MIITLVGQYLVLPILLSLEEHHKYLIQLVCTVFPLKASEVTCILFVHLSTSFLLERESYCRCSKPWSEVQVGSWHLLRGSGILLRGSFCVGFNLSIDWPSPGTAHVSCLYGFVSLGRTVLVLQLFVATQVPYDVPYGHDSHSFTQLPSVFQRTHWDPDVFKSFSLSRVFWLGNFLLMPADVPKLGSSTRGSMCAALWHIFWGRSRIVIYITYTCHKYNVSMSFLNS